MQDFTQAVERIVAGFERREPASQPAGAQGGVIPQVGHAYWAWRCAAADTVHKVSIIPRGVGALGYTIQLTEDRFLMSRLNWKTRWRCCWAAARRRV